MSHTHLFGLSQLLSHLTAHSLFSLSWLFLFPLSLSSHSLFILHNTSIPLSLCPFPFPVPSPFTSPCTLSGLAIVCFRECLKSIPPTLRSSVSKLPSNLPFHWQLHNVLRSHSAIRRMKTDRRTLESHSSLVRCHAQCSDLINTAVSVSNSVLETVALHVRLLLWLSLSNAVTSKSSKLMFLG